MTDAEFWGCLAETIKGAGCLPEYVYADGVVSACAGLCDCIAQANRIGLVHIDQNLRLLQQLTRAYRPSNVDESGYWWPPYATRPRIAACRALMRECLAKGL